jgi:hypothetical protein
MDAHCDYSESRFEPESILPSQFVEGRNKNEALEPIKRLMLAVLTDAVRCYQVAPMRKRSRADGHFERPRSGCSERSRMVRFSFENVCCTLDIAADYLRDALHKWQARRVRGDSSRGRPSLASGDVSETNDNSHSQQVSVRC